MKANNCYECMYYRNGFDRHNPIANTGVCARVEDAPYFVSKNRKTCIFDNPGERLSTTIIKTRDKTDKEKNENFTRYLEHASKIVESWPVWK